MSQTPPSRNRPWVVARGLEATLRAAVLCGAAAAALRGAPARAAECGDDPTGFDRWLEGFKQYAMSAGISPAVIGASLGDVAYDSTVIAHDRTQHGFGQNFAQFAAKRVSAARIRKGKSMLVAYAEAFDKIERRFGVPGPVLVAIWGLESEFGAGSGTYPTFNALATLAYDCRRADEFRVELLDALKIVQRGDLDPTEMRGAWAGEIGQTQFLPSAYLKYATGIDGSHAVDLIGNSEDALASTANFLHAKGWQRGAGWDEGEPNFAALMEWNSAPVYAKTIAYFADKLAAGGGAER
jgi:lytic murein transglycosylase